MKFKMKIIFGLFFVMVTVLFTFYSTQLMDKPVVVKQTVENVTINDNEKNIPETLNNIHSIVTETPIEEHAAILFPRSDITVGMTAEELLEKYKKTGNPYTSWYDLINNYKKYNLNNFCEFIRKNPFWNSITVFIEEGCVQMLRYDIFTPEQKMREEMGIYSSDDALKKTEDLFEHLKLQLGNEFEKVICRTGNSRAIMFLWEKDEDWVAFIPSPLHWGKADKFGTHRLYIFRERKYLDRYHRTISSDIPEGVTLWLEDAP